MTSAKTVPDPEFIIRTGLNGIACFSNGLASWPDSDGDDFIFSGSSNGIISLWSMKTRRSILSIDTKTNNSILKVSCLKENKILCHDRNGIIARWDLNSLEPIVEEIFPIHQLGFCPVSVLEREEEVLVCYQANSDSHVNVINFKDKTIIGQLKPEKKLGMVMHAKLFTEKETNALVVLVGYEDGSVVLWDVTAGKVKQSLKVHNDAVMSMDVDSECSKAVVGSADNRLVQLTISPTSGEFLKEINSIETKSHGIACLKVRPDNKIVAAGCWDGRVRLFGWKKLKPLAVLKYHSETVNCIVFTVHNHMVCGCKDGKISVWHIY